MAGPVLCMVQMGSIGCTAGNMPGYTSGLHFMLSPILVPLLPAPPGNVGE